MPCTIVYYMQLWSRNHIIYQGKNTRMSCHFLLQGIFTMQGSNQGLVNCRLILYCLSHQGSQYIHINTTKRLHLLEIIMIEKINSLF